MHIEFIDIHTHKSYKYQSNIFFIRQAYMLEFVPQTPNYFVSKGIHPWFIDKSDESKLDRLLGHQKVLAIGECGLDRNKPEFEMQRKIFQVQIDLSQQFGKPLIIHVVKAYDEIEQMLRGIKVPAIIHQYQGNQIQTKRLLENEMIYFSVGKQIFNESKKSFLEDIPLTRLFFETDTQTYSVQKVYESYCKIFHLDLAYLQAQIRNNFEQVFHLIP